MKRKNLLKLISMMSIALIVSLLSQASLCIPIAHAQIKLTYANFPPAVTFPCIQMERWKTEVEKRTNGKLKIQTFPGGTLISARNMFDGVIAGTADIGCLATSYQPGAFPLVEAADLPIGWPNATVTSASLWDLVEKYKPKEFEKVKVITMFAAPPANIMSMKPIRNLADIKGYELRAAGTAAKILELLGATPVAMPQSDVPEALQKGVVKGNVSELGVLKSFKYAEYCRFVTENVNLFTVTFTAVMNRSKWDSLPTDLKKVIDDLGREQSIWTGKLADDQVNEGLQWAKDKYNVQVYNLSKDELAKWFDLLKPMREQYIKDAEAKGLPAKAILSDVMRLKEKYGKEYAK